MASEQQEFQFEPIKGYPYLHWKGKQPYTSTQYFPAQSRERIGEEQDGWINRLYWGDNLQVMSHLLKEFRGKIDLIYIDPPFDSKADYKRKIEIRGKTTESDFSAFEDKQYEDIWSNDEYLQFMYERLILMRELLSDKGSIYLHCDWHKSHHLRMLMDEIFGPENFVNEIIWHYRRWSGSTSSFQKMHDTIFWYSKNNKFIFNTILQPYTNPDWIEDTVRGMVDGKLIRLKDENGNYLKREKENEGVIAHDVWEDINFIAPTSSERLGYPTQKPEALIERVIKASSKPSINDDPASIVFDCFMGSGTTQAVAMKLGRRFLGADINLGAIQTTMKRLSKIKKELDCSLETEEKKYTSFKIFNVNRYDFFKNPVQAKDLLIDYFGIQKLDSNSPYDGRKDGRMWKIIPVNRIASKADISAFVANLPYNEFEKIKEKNPHEAVEKFTFVCMGHEPGLKAELEKQLASYKIEVEIVDILRNEAILELKREAEADVQRKGNKIIIKKFYPMNLMQKLSLERTTVHDWKELVDSVMIDFNYDQVEMQPSVIDIPEKNNLVKGEYEIPKDAGRIRVKITDLISESFETELY